MVEFDYKVLVINIINNRILKKKTYLERYNNNSLNDLEETARNDILFNIIKFRSNFLNFIKLNFSLSGDIGLLEALCRANTSVIVVLLLA